MQTDKRYKKMMLFGAAGVIVGTVGFVLMIADSPVVAIILAIGAFS